MANKCPFADKSIVRCSVEGHPLFGAIYVARGNKLHQFNGKGWADVIAQDNPQYTNDERCDAMQRCTKGKNIINSASQYYRIIGKKAAPPPNGPRLCIGSAFLPASDGLAKRPEAWQTVRQASGMHVHPMGFIPRMDKAGLMAQYGHKKYTLEEDLNNAWVVAKASGMTWIHHVRAAAPDWECLGFMPNVMTDVLFNDPKGTAANFDAYFSDCKAAGVPCYVLFSPVSPEAAAIGLERLLNQKVDGVYLPIWVARKSGAVGIAIDYPAMHYTGRQMAPPEFRELGKAIGTRAQEVGLKFAWMFNGASTPDETQETIKDISNTLRPDLWVMSGFQDPNIRAVPENGYTLTGQAKPIVVGGF